MKIVSRAQLEKLCREFPEHAEAYRKSVEGHSLPERTTVFNGLRVDPKLLAALKAMQHGGCE